jgi:hypothetical protein
MFVGHAEPNAGPHAARLLLGETPVRLHTASFDGGYDVVLDLFCNPRTAVWTAATGARLRIGYRGKGWRSAVYNRHPVHEGKSAVRWHLASIAALGWPVDAHAVPQLPMRLMRSPPRARLGPAMMGAWSRCIPARWPTRRGTRCATRGVARRAGAQARVLVIGGPGKRIGAAQRGLGCCGSPGSTCASWPRPRLLRCVRGLDSGPSIVAVGHAYGRHPRARRPEHVFPTREVSSRRTGGVVATSALSTYFCTRHARYRTRLRVERSRDPERRAPFGRRWLNPVYA